MQELFRRALPGRIHFDEIGQHAFGTELAGAPVLERGEQFLRRFRRVAVMRQDVFDRFAFGAQTGTLGAQLVDLLTKLGRGLASAREAFLGLAAVRRDALEFELALGDSLGKLLLDACEALDFSRGDFFFLLHARPFALDSGEISVGLRDLVPDGRRFAEQAQNHGTRRFDRLLGFPHARLNRVARLVLFEQAGADFLHLLLEFCQRSAPARPARFRCCCSRPSRSLVSCSARVMRCSMLEASRTCDSRRPLVRSASRFISASCRRASVSCGFERVENFLRFLPLGVVIGGLYGQVLEFGGGCFERGGSAFGFRFQRHVPARRAPCAAGLRVRLSAPDSAWLSRPGA